jgi:hypothetical protein
MGYYRYGKHSIAGAGEKSPLLLEVAKQALHTLKNIMERQHRVTFVEQKASVDGKRRFWGSLFAMLLH